MDLPDRKQATSWEGMQVVDRDGEALGTCLGVFADTETGVTEWLDIDVQGRSRSFVPAIDAGEADGVVRVAFTRSAIYDAPAVGDQEQLSKRDETELYRHYGVPVATTGSVLPADAAAGDSDTSVGGGDAAGVGTAAVAGTGLAAASATGLAGTSGTTGAPGTDASRDVDAPLDVDAPGGDASGLDLPVLDPAAANVPVPAGATTDVDDRDAPTEAAAPRLRRVTTAPTTEAAPTPTATAASWPPPSPASGSGSGALAAGAPIAGIAGLAGAVFLAMRARDKRRSRRTSPVAKADRLRRQATIGSALLKASAARSLSAGQSAAATTGRQVATTAAKQLSATQAAAASTGRQLSAAAAAASKEAALKQRKAAKQATRRKRRLASSLATASNAAAKSGSAATSAVSSSLDQASKRVSRRKRAAERRQRVAETKRSAARRRKAAAKSVATAPRTVAKKGRRVRKSLARKAWELVLATAAGGGYVLGAKAGRERYAEITDAASAVAASPQVQSLTDSVTDPTRRAQLIDAVKRRAGLAGQP